MVVVGFCVDAGDSGSGGDDNGDDDVDVGGSAVGGAMSMAGWFFFCPGFEGGFWRWRGWFRSHRGDTILLRVFRVGRIVCEEMGEDWIWSIVDNNGRRIRMMSSMYVSTLVAFDFWHGEIFRDLHRA